MSRFAAFLASSADGPVILDGGLATTLEARGNDINNPLWSASMLLTKPEEILAVHESFIEAGAEIITTSSYQLSRQGFEHEGLSGDKWRECALLSVKLAKDAVAKAAGDRPVLIGGSIGPLGACFHDGSEYSGWYGLPPSSEGKGAASAVPVPLTSALTPGLQSVETIIAFHRPRALALIEGGCDFLAFETIPCVMEVRAIVELVVKELAAPCWISMQCRNTSSLASGEPIDEALDAIASADPEGKYIPLVGVNCLDPRLVEGCIGAIKAHPSASKRRVVVYANRGETWNATTGRWEGQGSPSDDEFVALAKKWKEAGAGGIGGCCRVGPELIHRLKRELR